MVQRSVTFVAVATLLVLAIIPDTRAAVPTGCVEIESAHKNQYLSLAGLYNENRRQVTVSNNVQQWNINRDGGNYRIQPRRTANELYAAGYTYDSDRRHVFVWEQSHPVIQGGWDIQELGNGRYLIRNTHENEFLYSADYPSRGHVFTWRGSVNARDDPQFHWRLSSC
uniref:16 kDa salivary protein n=1 Tax=Culex tarsalis TaxID=7177 RepID=B8RJI1_CULTA